MIRWIAGTVLSPLLAAFVIGPGPAADPANDPGVVFPAQPDGFATASQPLATGKPLGKITSHVPARPRFVLRGTMPIAPRRFQRFPCPLVVVDPTGRALPTQWELVARTRDHMIVEVLAVVDQNTLSGRQTYTVHQGQSNLETSAFHPSTLGAIYTNDAIRLALQDQNGNTQEVSLSGLTTNLFHYRKGSAAVTTYRFLRGTFGDVHVWMTVQAHCRQIELVLNWTNGGLPASPDAYFRSLALNLPPGVSWTPVLPDPAMSPPLLVRPGDHILPQRMERNFRVVIHPTGQVPDLSQEGWGVGDWSKGGYMPQAIALPNLDHTPIDLTSKKDDDFYRLTNLLPTQPGSVPVSELYPAQGVFYGGMTGGLEIEQYPFVALAVTGQPDGLLSAYVEQLRYGSRQLGCIYEKTGLPIELDDYLNPDGTTPWSMYNNEFQVLQGTIEDAPFFFSRTGPGQGKAAYDPLDFDPIDYQHYVRRTKANKALAWLSNDPLAKLYLLMDAELGRMTFYEGPGGRLQVPSTPGLGMSMGRGEAWVADTMAAAYAVADDAWRQRTRPWFTTFVQALTAAQMPNKLFSAQSTGKSATSPPYGNGRNAFYWVHRSNEQIFLMLALRAIDRTIGVDTTSLIRTCGEGLWYFAWKVGTTGPLDRYPAGPINGPRYATRSQIPAGLTATVVHDSYHVGTALAHAQVEGANMLPALLAYTGAQDLTEALAILEAWGVQNLANRANTLALLQSVVP